MSISFYSNSDIFFVSLGMERSTCCICKKKVLRRKMVKHGQHWTCTSCVIGSPSILEIDRPIKVLNLYAGVGGNRWHWPGTLQVTAVEINPLIGGEYKRNFPGDRLIIGDAHQYLLKNYQKFDVIWSSPPCQTHSKMNYVMEHKRYIDVSLYQEIIFLRSFFKGKYIVENVRPYYDPLISPQFILNRHCFWTNVSELREVKLPEFEERFRGRNKGMNVMDKVSICKWLGVKPGTKNIYLPGAKSSEQIYRNCVHPLLGKSLMDDVILSMTG